MGMNTKEKTKRRNTEGVNAAIQGNISDKTT